MGNSGPAVLSSAMMARKGVAVPTGYSQQQPPQADSTPRLDGTVQPLKAVKPAPVALGGGTPPSDRVRVSVRLDRARHRKLRLAAAHANCSLQELIVDALDRFLEDNGPELVGAECACLGVAGTATLPNGEMD